MSVVVEPQLLPDKLGKEVDEVRAEPGDPPSNIAWFESYFYSIKAAWLTFMDVDMRSALSPLSSLLTSSL